MLDRAELDELKDRWSDCERRRFEVEHRRMPSGSRVHVAIRWPTGPPPKRSPVNGTPFWGGDVPDWSRDPVCGMSSTVGLALRGRSPRGGEQTCQRCQVALEIAERLVSGEMQAHRDSVAIEHGWEDVHRFIESLETLLPGS